MCVTAALVNQSLINTGAGLVAAANATLQQQIVNSLQTATNLLNNISTTTISNTANLLTTLVRPSMFLLLSMQSKNSLIN